MLRPARWAPWRPRHRWSRVVLTTCSCHPLPTFQQSSLFICRQLYSLQYSHPSHLLVLLSHESFPTASLKRIVTSLGSTCWREWQTESIRYLCISTARNKRARWVHRSGTAAGVADLRPHARSPPSSPISVESVGWVQFPRWSFGMLTAPPTWPLMTKPVHHKLKVEPPRPEDEVSDYKFSNICR